VIGRRIRHRAIRNGALRDRSFRWVAPNFAPRLDVEVGISFAHAGAPVAFNEGHPVFGLGKSKAVVGLDIGSSAVKAVELKAVGKKFKVSAFGIEPIPPDSIVDGAIIDGTAVADAIKRLFANKAFKTKDVAASLSGNAVIVKKINLPVMTESELAESIYWEAEQYIPFDIQDVNLDYQIIDPGTGADSKGTMDVLLVAAKKDKIADYTGVISQAGRVPVVVDVDAFALQNAYEVNYGLDAQAVVVLLNAGASAININIVGGDQSLFTRDISIGGNAYTEAIQKELDLPFDAAEQLKKGQPVSGMNFDDVRPVLHAMTDNVLLEIQKTFDFFKATAASDRIDKIFLCGGASRVDGFAEALAERFGAPVEPFDPFRAIAFEPNRLGVADADVEGLMPSAVVAVGLALRRMGD
jgi:type IV pilus assembly protein PilM